MPNPLSISISMVKVKWIESVNCLWILFDRQWSEYDDYSVCVCGSASPFDDDSDSTCHILFSQACATVCCIVHLFTWAH